MVKAQTLRWGLGACAAAFPLVFSLSGTNHGGTDSLTGKNPAAVVILSCGPSNQPNLLDPHHALCETLHQTLATTFPDYVFQRLSSADPSPQNPDHELWITLHITRADTHFMDAYLEWSEAGSEAITGPTVTLSVLDRPLTPALYPSLARSLIKNSALPL